MSKAKVISLAKKQGATVEILDPYSNGELEVCVMLPDGMIWDNRSDSGVIVITREYDQSLAEFWESILSEMNYPVIKAGA
jgi:hypothetical protein